MTDLHTASADPSSRFASRLDTTAVMRAFKRALVSQCHPTMLFAVLLPFLIALLGAFLLWLFWSPLTDWLRVEASQWDVINRFDE